MKLALVILTVFMSTVGLSQTDRPTRDVKTHRIELVYPNYYYYDNRFFVSLPVVNVGIKYQFTKQNNWGVQSAILLDHMRNFKGADEFGDIVERNALYPSFGSHYRFLSKNGLELMCSAEVEGRLGWLSYFASSNDFEIVLGQYELLDVAAKIGLTCVYQFKKRLFFSFEIDHSFYIYRYDMGFDPWIKPSPFNVSKFSLGIGWRLNRIKSN
ncbi:MAG: hypothetical protein R2780_01700 [Crocinitomicaceae bacterium]